MLTEPYERRVILGALPHFAHAHQWAIYQSHLCACLSLYHAPYWPGNVHADRRLDRKIREQIPMDQSCRDSPRKRNMTMLSQLLANSDRTASIRFDWGHIWWRGREAYPRLSNTPHPGLPGMSLRHLPWRSAHWRAPIILPDELLRETEPF